ncbi:ADP-ribose glycohydrolase ARH3 [Sarcoptes scabiei]|uniref:ADP-ribosylhydrolase ARH3 n=1 Tax=Sarcoptes scabiei TaxID=52283 RepID=A0A834R8E3_SARSC|nr:ADP-ribose glycohydrolase ARH3 [Sarcoptes scabiei]
MSTQSSIVSLMSKFRGCLLGGLVGDCFGSPYEGEMLIADESVQKFLAKQLEEQSEKAIGFQILNYTDDTAMTKSIAQSLIEIKKFDPKDIAKRFALEYNKEPKRGYGTNVVDVFAALMLANYEAPYEPAKRQFGGFGSYGNGGAMRVGPCAMFGYYMELDKLIELTKDSARITHANVYGYNGAILQCLAIHQALHAHSLIKSSSISMNSQHAYSVMNNITQEKPATPFTDKLKKIKDLINNEIKGIKYPIEKIVTLLGNDVSAFKSVPTAIYAALKGQLRIVNGFDSKSPLVRTVYNAIILGGDTDTIGSMACSISGAINGIESIPKILLKHCESSDIMEKYADDLYRLVRSNHSPITSN